MKKLLLLLTVMMASIATVNAQKTVYMLGFATNEAQVNMTSTDDDVFTAKNVTLKDGALAFTVVTDGTPINWSGTAFPEGNASVSPLDLTVVAGTYDVTLKLSDGAYTFATPGVISVANVGIIGTAVTGWDADVDMTTTDDDTYTLVDYTLSVGELKFRAGDAWVDGSNWGPAAGSEAELTGTATATDGKNITISVAGTYDITFNRTTKVYSVVAKSVSPVVTVSLTGAALAADQALTSTDGDVYTASNVVLTAATLQFTVTTDDVAVMWGATAFPEGTATEGTDMIGATAGAFNVSYTKSTGAYKFTDASVVVVANVGIIGTAVTGWDADVDMTTTDDDTYTLVDYTLSVGELKFRAGDAWVDGSNWGPAAGSEAELTGTATATDGKNITISVAGTYDITFNRTTKVYSVVAKSVSPVVTVSLTGAALAADQALTSTDGDVYTASNVVLTAATLQFTVTTDDVAVMWGATAFPEGTATEGTDMIGATAGTFNVSYTKSTGAYKFTDASVVVVANVGVIGTAVTGWDADVDMTTTDDDTYTLEAYDLLAGELKFREGDAWTVSWGPVAGSESELTGTATATDGKNITIAEAGKYDITFNRTTKAYSITVTTVGLEGVDVDATEVAIQNPVIGGQLELSVVADVEVYDLSGRLVSTSTDVSSLNAGLYLVIINGVQTQKVIIE